MCSARAAHPPRKRAKGEQRPGVRKTVGPLLAALRLAICDELESPLRVR
jgi:hypothetical protein